MNTTENNQTSIVCPRRQVFVKSVAYPTPARNLIASENHISDHAVTPPLNTFKPRLEALTSLRFFAAASIVLSHMQYFFPEIFSFEVIDKIPLAQGVSFFFVLSGFILTYVYPSLAGLKNISTYFRNSLFQVLILQILSN